MQVSREQRRQLERDNEKWPLALQEIPRADWPPGFTKPSRVWRSRHWLVQEFIEPYPVMVRLSINRTSAGTERWEDGISWDALQAIKRELGYGAHDAVEVFPADADVVNVANMRHLWIMADLLTFAWRKRG